MLAANNLYRMKKYIFLLFVILVGFSVDDVQKEIITLEWSESTGLAEGDAFVSFENANLIDSPYELPVYTRLYPLENNDKSLRFVIQNPVYELLESNQSFLSENEISEDFQISTRQLKSANSLKVELKIIPLKRQDGKIYRLKSFELKKIPVDQKTATTEMEWKTQSVLSSGKWVKISTSGKGIYKIPYSKWSEWGFSNPSQVGVFVSGGTLLPENPANIV